MPVLSLGKPHSCTESLLPNLALPPAFSLRKEDTSPQTQTGTDGHFVMQMRAPAQRTKLQPRGKGAGPFPADKSKKGGALKMTLPLPHPQPALKRKSNRAQGPGSGFLPSNSEAHTSSKEPNRLTRGCVPLVCQVVNKKGLRDQSLQKYLSTNIKHLHA